MKVLFVNAPWVGKAIYPPLGLAYLAAVLDRKGIENDLIDSEAKGYSVPQLEKEVKKRNPEIICLTGTTPSIESVFRCARALKKSLPQSTILIGGPHASALPEDCINRDGIDIVIVGEGEMTIVELVAALDSGAPLKGVKGLCYKENGKTVMTSPRELIEDINSIPFPARYKLDLDKYVGSIGLPKVGRIATVMTSRGCPYQCTYCSSHIIWKGRLRMRSAENVLQELEELVERYHVKAIMFKDDTLAVNKQRLKDICRGMMDRKMNLLWSCSSRVDNVNKELLELMHRAGCRLIEFGFESGSQRVLDRMKKGTSLDQARQAVKWCKEIGISINGFFMIGNPQETIEDVEKTIEFAKELNPDNAQWAITTPYPGTQMFVDMKDRIGKVENWDSFLHCNPLYPGESTPAVLLSDIPPEMLHDYVKSMTRHFILRPKRIARNLLKIRSAKELMRQVKAGYRLAFAR